VESEVTYRTLTPKEVNIMKLAAIGIAIAVIASGWIILALGGFQAPEGPQGHCYGKGC